MAVSRIRFGRISAWEEGSGTYTHSHTLQVRNRDLVADIALVGAWYRSNRHSFGRNSAYAGITQIISAEGVEEFTVTQRPTLFCRNVTSVTFSIQVNDATAFARYILYYWD